MPGMRRDDEQVPVETRPGLDVSGDLGLGSAMRIVGSQRVDGACRENDREAANPGDASEGSASKQDAGTQIPFAGESAALKSNDRPEKRPGGGGAETASLREDQHEARSTASRRVSAPRNCKRPHSLQNLKSNVGERRSYSATISGGTTPTALNGTTTTFSRTTPPVIPPRSPLRPSPRYQLTPPTLLGTTPQATAFDPVINSPAPSVIVDEGDDQIILMPSLRESFGGSLTVLLATLEAEALHDKALPLPPGQEDELILDYSDEIEEDYDPDSSQPSSTDSLTLDVSTFPAPAGPTTPNPPTVMTKRVHALRELLSSERAYASDLALIRDIHIPLALGRSPFSSWPALIL